MNKTIWKFNLKTIDTQIIEMPAGADVLTVQVQNGTPCLWAMVDPGESTRKRTFKIFGTGHQINNYKNVSLLFIGTYQLLDCNEVFHVFEYVEGI